MIWEYLTALLNVLPWLLATVFLGVFVADVLAQRGLFIKLGAPFRFVVRIAGLPLQLSSVLTVGLIDSRAEHSILSTLYKEGKIGDRHVMSYTMMAMPFSGTRLLIQYTLPTAVALLGVDMGLMYFLLMVIALLVAIAIGVVIGRTSPKLQISVDELEARRGAASYKAAAKKALRMCYRVGIRYVVVYTVVTALFFAGVFTYVENLGKAITAYTPLGVYPVTIAVLYSTSPIAAMALAGELASKGLATAKEALMRLILGRLFFAVISEYPRHSFPFYVSFYPVKLAAKLTALLILNTAVSVPVQLLVLGVSSA